MSDQALQASAHLLKALGTAHTPHGLLLGYASSSLGVVLLDLYYFAEGDVQEVDASDLAVLLPYGWSVVGCFINSTSLSQQELASKAQQLLTPVKEWWPDHNACVVAAITGGSSSKPQFYEYSTPEELAPVESVQQVEDAKLRELLVACRCRCSLTLDVYTSQAGDFKAGVQVAQQAAAAQLDAPGLAFMVHRPGTSPTIITSTSTDPVSSIRPSSPSTATTTTTAPSTSTSHLPTVYLQPLLDCTTARQPPAEFAYDYQPVGVADCQLRRVGVELDVVCVVESSGQLGEAVEGALLPGLHRQLACVAERLAALASLDKVLKARSFHCQPPGRQHTVTMLYLHQSPDPEAVETEHMALRRRLHSRLGLPDARPCLRAAQALGWEVDAAAGAAGGVAAAAAAAVQRLRNVHQGLTPPVAGGTVYLLDGSYDYHHYMQDKFNDAGWGCAYRSLQTICSWFRAQLYTSKPVPSHREIQDILVKLGDKDSSFVGSSNWIGAIELSYILDEHLGVTSKIVTVNRGEDIPSRARELAHHFVTQGTPVMIGGGVLAYTLLGVQLHEQTGECAFLILDPHYTGGEDLHKIQQGTWVGWKKYGDNAAAGGPLFVADAFYNFLCPQRPKVV